MGSCDQALQGDCYELISVLGTIWAFCVLYI